MLIGEVLKREQLTTIRGHNQLMNRLNREEGEYHKSNVMPRHFELGAFQRYRYDRRSRKYEDRKRKRFGHTRPMVFRDQLRPIVLATARVTATKSRWRVLARGTTAHRLSNKHREELERVSDVEKREIGERISRKYRQAVANGEVQERKRKRLKAR